MDQSTSNRFGKVEVRLEPLMTESFSSNLRTLADAPTALDLERGRQEILSLLKKTGKALSTPLPILAAEVEQTLLKQIESAEGLTQSSGISWDASSQPSTLFDRAENLLSAVKIIRDLKLNNPEQVEASLSKVFRVARGLSAAIDTYRPLDELITKLTLSIASLDQNQNNQEVYRDVARASIALSSWEFSNTNWDNAISDRSYVANLVNQIAAEREIKLLIFVCPPCDFSALAFEYPEEYFGVSLTGSFLLRQKERLLDLTNGLKALGVRYSFSAVIGDTDEQDYIWPVLGKPENLDEQKVDLRRTLLAERVFDFLIKSQIAKPENLTVLGLGAIKSLAEDKNSATAPSTAKKEERCDRLGFSEQDIASEIERMTELWGPESYYKGLPIPTSEQLREIALSKFLAYAAQGELLQEFSESADSILIQAELPPLLRNKMLSAGLVLSTGKEWPAILMNPPEQKQ